MALMIALLFSVSMFTVAFKTLADESSDPFVVKKFVDNGESKLKIDEWLAGEGYDPADISAILADISFELYPSNESGAQAGDVPVAVCGVGADGTIAFPPGVGSGWYLMREVLGEAAKALFREDTADLLICYEAGPEFADDTRFTVTQYKDQTRQLQALYRDADGIVRTAYTSPALGVDPPVPGGGALGSSRFEVTQDNGAKFTSFCADIGAIQCYGEFIIDDTKHNFTSDQMLRLIAALDFIYARSGFAQYDDVALAQLVVWNLILVYTNDPMTADMWLLAPGLLLKDEWGELFKIEGVSIFNNVEYWYKQAYRDLVDDIIANADNDKYVDIHYARIDAGAKKYINGAYFLRGDDDYPGYMQQRQLIITFGSSATYSNVPVTPTPTPTPTPPPERGRLEVRKLFNIEVVPDEWSAKIAVTGPDGYRAEGTVTGAERVYTLTDLVFGQYTVIETDADGITGYLFMEVTGNGTYEVGAGTTTATLTNAYATPTPTPTPTPTVTPTPTPTPRVTPTPTPRGTPTPTPSPDRGRLEVTKAFNIAVVPDDWSATITVTGPNGFSAEGTITGANRVFILTDLDYGLYTVTETDPDDIAFHTFVNVTGEGSYTVGGGTTAATITNNYEVEIGNIDVPQDDFPIDLPDTPKSDMPKTDVDDNTPLYARWLCLSALVLGFSLYVIRYPGRLSRKRE